MPPVTRVLTPAVATLDLYRESGGGRGLEAARRLGPAATIEEIEVAGLRGRGGAGFPTGTKWRTVAEHATTADDRPTVVVNGAEGEPGTFKDRTLLRANPYLVLEGALIAAFAVGADTVVVAVKATFADEISGLRRAAAEMETAGMVEGVTIEVVEGPSEYLFGEETGLLEVVAGRPPFPRIAPPFRHGVEETGLRPERPGGTVMAQEEPGGAAPTLANNVETLANVPLILAEGPTWFRSVGTAESPGTILCTVSGSTRRAGVGEFAMGTPLAEVIEHLGGGANEGRTLVAAISGVANPLLPASLFDTPLTYEDMLAAGSGLGAGGFIVFDDIDDLGAVAAGVSRFLAVESCGQCVPCKQDGLALADRLEAIVRGRGAEADLAVVADLTRTVSDEARCYLANQHEVVMASVLERFPDALRRHLDPAVEPAAPVLIAPLIDITGAGTAVVDDSQATKQPDWTHDGVDSGQAPVDRLGLGSGEG